MPKQASITSFFKTPSNRPKQTGIPPSSGNNSAVASSATKSFVTSAKKNATPFSSTTKENFKRPLEPKSLLQSGGVKKKKIMVSDDDEDDDVTGSSKVPQVVVIDDDDDQSEAVLEKTVALRAVPFQTPRNTSSRASVSSARSTSTFKPSASASASSKLDSFSFEKDKKQQRKETFLAKQEEKYTFLLEENIRDANGRPVGDPDYDPRTLKVPKSFFEKATPFEKQYWEIKRKNYDTVLFFQKGKFYELFCNDAELGSRLFDLKLTDRGAMSMVGVPEYSFHFWASKFIAKGYKVARVEQMETALGKEMRERDVKKKDDIVRRELTQVLTAGTLVDPELLPGDDSIYCLSLKECVNVDSPSKVLFGVCFVDTSTGHFFLSEFEDDLDRSLLETLLVQINVKEIVYERGKLSVQTKKLLKNLCGEDASWNGLKVNDEFWDAKRTQEEVLRRSYFKELPDLLKGNNESVSAFGGLVWYLSQLKLDESLIKHENIKYYDILESKTSMVLDGQSLINLEIFETTEGTKEGSLFELINHCLTPFGKRKLKKWICHPLQDTQKIEQRLNSVDLLMKTSTIEIEKGLKKCPDFERLLSRCMARKLRLKDYPGFIESLRTVLNKIESFKNELNSSENSLLMQNIDEILACKEKLGAELKRISASFDIKKAKDGELEIFEGFEQDYDDIVAVNKKIVNELNKHLADVREKFQCKEVEYRDIGKEIFQLQFPAKYADKVPSNWATKSSSKAVVRYYSPFLVDKVREYQEAQETLNSVRGELLNRYLDKLNAFAVEISIIAKNLGDIDCLLSLAKVSSQLKGMSNGDACKPVFLDKKMINGSSMIMFKNLRHPCLINNNYNNNVFIPNDIHLGGNEANMILLSGPNMGGKSTLLRQTCIAVILAHVGCYIPASDCEMTVVDRIFTRIGANDNILAGQSTFMVELSETSKIMAQATSDSLVILDELGRGTSTFDGYGIAYSVLNYLSIKKQCMGLFSTHYGLLNYEYKKLAPSPSVKVMHMDCVVDDVKKEVMFLYKLKDGYSEKSYGMNVAKMSGIPIDIVMKAEDAANERFGTKGWIGAVGTSDVVANKAFGCRSQNLLVREDAQTLVSLLSKLKLDADKKISVEQKTVLLKLWSNTKTRYCESS